MKRVKIAKYTKEKRQKARDEYNKEQSKIKYKTFENMRYTLYELWKSQPIMLMLIVLHIFSNVAATLLIRSQANMLLSLLWEHHHA